MCSALPRLPRVIHDVGMLRAAIAAARAGGRAIHLVPTMGALHAGHLSLVDRARREGGFTVVSVFVNPTQFAPGEDYGRYPRTLSADCAALEKTGTEVVFAPDAKTMYRPEHATTIEVAGPALPFEGQFRPGHFQGVATVVLKLLNLVQPDRAYFGRKDYQQCLVVQQMVADFDLPIEIEVCPTVREPDGLAMSSRNAYLSADDRRQALSIYQSLELARNLIRDGERNAEAIARQMHDKLTSAGLQVDYAAIADPHTLAPQTRIRGKVVALIAARVGNTRLIDNEVIE